MTDFDLVIRNAKTSAPDIGLRNIGIRSGIITAISGRDESLAAATVIDADGRWVIPGAIDTHTHIGQLAPEYAHLPGLSEIDNYAYETRAAIAGPGSQTSAARRTGRAIDRVR